MNAKVIFAGQRNNQNTIEKVTVLDRIADGKKPVYFIVENAAGQKFNAFSKELSAEIADDEFVSGETYWKIAKGTFTN